jgi:hypothetical protein
MCRDMVHGGNLQACYRAKSSLAGVNVEVRPAWDVRQPSSGSSWQRSGNVRTNTTITVAVDMLCSIGARVLCVCCMYVPV